MPISVLLVDDEPLVRAGLRAILEAQTDIEVAGEAADGASVVPLARKLRPDVIAMDVRMPLLDGIEATRAVLRSVPEPPRILVVTTFEEEVLRLMSRGLSNAEIADELVLGAETVKTHVSSVLGKLGARDRTQAVIAAYESGFVSPG
ncbi:response regulator transcription factor [Streptomyces sp. C10]|uniref:response regulator transcription factor n=1 Tax=Streptomyces sp. C10 TaxID=531941 RepID=UPI0039817749